MSDERRVGSGRRPGVEQLRLELADAHRQLDALAAELEQCRSERERALLRLLDLEQRHALLMSERDG